MTESQKTTEDFESKFGRLEARIAELEKSATVKAPKVPKVKRAPTAYNTFIGEAIKNIKLKNPEIKHSDAFKQAAVEWSLSKKTTTD